MNDYSQENKTNLEVPLAGEVCVQYIRCGKPVCRCQQGQLHGPYHYRVWREGTQVRKVYVKARDVETVKAACAAHKNLSQDIRDMKQERVRLTQGILKEWRRAQRYFSEESTATPQ